MEESRDSEEKEPYNDDDRPPYIRGDDGVFYSTRRRVSLEAIEKERRKSPVKCGSLFDAVSDNDLEKVKEILCYDDKSPEKVEFRKWYVNEKTWSDWRALHAAADEGNVEMAQFLLDCGSEINALSDVKYTALHLAASGGHAELTKLLLDKGADIKILTEAGLKGTALHHAAGKGHYECVRILVERPDCEELVNAFSYDYCTALYYAVVKRDLDIVKLLIEKGAKKTINDCDWGGLTPLHTAAMGGFMEIVQYLVEVGGADVKLKDQLDRTPADIAKEMGQTEIMDYLNNKMSQ